MKLRCVPDDLTSVSVALSDSGDLVALVSGKRIIVWAYHLKTADAAKSIKFQSGGTTDLTGAMLGTDHNAEAIGTAQYAIPVLETAVGEKLNLVCSAAEAVGGFLIYSTAKE